MKNFICFGMRCNTAFILRWILNLQKQSLPFDWNVMNTQTQLEILKHHNSPEIMIDIYNKLFSNSTFNFNEKKSFENSWFPHDEIFIENIDNIRDKYIKRTNRLYDIIHNSDKKIFLTLFLWESNDCGKMFLNTIEESCIKNFLLITINGSIDEIFTNNYINMNVKFVPEEEKNDDYHYNCWMSKIINRLKNLECFEDVAIPENTYI